MPESEDKGQKVRTPLKTQKKEETEEKKTKKDL